MDFVAEVIKTHFPEIDVRASVNMAIASVSGMKYIKNYFDSFYIARELNRYPQKIKILKQWCEANNKKLFLLANSGCLRDCSAHTFHDNLVFDSLLVKFQIACQTLTLLCMGTSNNWFCNENERKRG